MAQLTNLNKQSNNDLKYLLFSLNEKKYAVDIAHVVEVVELTELEYPQKLPTLLCGLLNYNHMTISIINTPKLLELGTKKFDLDNQILILKTEESIFGFVVDKVFDLISIQTGEIHLRPYNSNNNIIKFISYYKNEMMFIFDLYSVEKFIKQNETNYTNEDSRQYFPQDANAISTLQKRKQNLIDKSEYPLPWEFVETDEFVWYTVGQQNYCINISFIKEITKLSKDAITQIPCTPEFVKGIISHHGEFYTVIDLGLFFEDKPIKTQNDFYKLIIINDFDFKVALLVSDIQNILKLPTEDILINSNNDENAKYFSQEFVLKETLYRILNLKVFLTDKRLFIYETV